MVEKGVNTPYLNSVRTIESEQKIEVVGKELRKMMSWIKNK